MKSRSSRAVVLGAFALLASFASGCCGVCAPNGEYAGFISDYHDHSKLQDLADTEIGAVTLRFDGDGSGKVLGTKDGKPFAAEFVWRQENDRIIVNGDSGKLHLLVMNGADELVFTDREFRIRCVFKKLDK